MTDQKCPKCGKKMVERNGRNGSFLGCSGYPHCKMTMSISKSQEKKELRKIQSPSAYQQAIFEFVLNKDKQNGVIKATAGSGKTTVQEHVVAVLIEAGVDPNDIIYLVYNSHVAEEGRERGLPAKTTHQIGLAIITAYRGNKRPEIDDNKVSDIVKSLIPEEDDKWMVAPVCDIVSKLKNTLAPWDDSSFDKICSKFGIEVNGNAEIIFELSRKTITESNKTFDVIDFDDMIYLPVKFKMPCRQYQWVLGDEVQDLNRVQIELIKRLSGGRTILVGDKNQSMYSFRGAAPDAMERLTEAFQADELPLSISYRNPASHVDLINRLFPHIKHEVAPNAKQGDILEMSVDRMLGEVKPGDIVICRNNAPLVQPVFELIKQGVKAVILGRDIGNNLINLVERFKTKEVGELLEKLVEYRAKEIMKLLKAEKTSQAQSLDDKVQTIIALSEGCSYTYQITQRIKDVFSAKKEGVVFSTVHKAKGSEAKNVYILYPQLMPSKYAKTEEDMQQEINVCFVALSRAKEKMIFVGGPAPTSFESQGMWEEDETIEDKDLESKVGE